MEHKKIDVKLNHTYIGTANCATFKVIDIYNDTHSGIKMVKILQICSWDKTKNKVVNCEYEMFSHLLLKDKEECSEEEIEKILKGRV